MEMSDFFKHFALYSALSAVIFGILLYRKTKYTNSSRMSYAATTSRGSYLLLAIGITASSSLLALCVYGYMLQQTAIPTLFFLLFGVMYCALLIIAWFPATKGINYKIHYWAAWIKTYLMFSVVALMYVDAYDGWSKGTSMVNGWMHVVGAGFVLALAITATYTNQKDLSPKKSIHSQQLIYVIFLLSVLARIYLG